MNYVIIGAGASGLYTALRLLRDGNLQPGDTVQVYEWSHRPGGRIYTYTFPPDLER
jgi:phytoene dehydrogenase-like protein